MRAILTASSLASAPPEVKWTRAPSFHGAILHNASTNSARVSMTKFGGAKHSRSSWLLIAAMTCWSPWPRLVDTQPLERSIYLRPWVSMKLTPSARSMTGAWCPLSWTDHGIRKWRCLSTHTAALLGIWAPRLMVSAAARVPDRAPTIHGSSPEPPDQRSPAVTPGFGRGGARPGGGV